MGDSISINIAICEDNLEQISKLREIIHEWFLNKSIYYNLDVYNNAESFLFSYLDKSYDLLLLDIEMHQMNGIELAKTLRNNNDMLPIIFITGFSEYMNQGYDVEALHYLLKPLDKEKFFSVLERYIQKYQSNDTIIIPCTDKTIHINQDNIMYCEAYGKSTQIYVFKGDALNSKINIGKLSKMLNQDFINCHRSYLVNLRFIQSINKIDITLDNGFKIPLSRRMYKEVNQKFIEYYTKEY